MRMLYCHGESPGECCGLDYFRVYTSVSFLLYAGMVLKCIITFIGSTFPIVPGEIAVEDLTTANITTL